MRVLFFSPIESDINSFNHGAGWVFSLINSVINNPEVEVGVTFWSDTDAEYKTSNIHYYQIKKTKETTNRLKRFIHNINLFQKINHNKVLKEWGIYEEKFLSVIDRFKPDIIHVFGTESPFGLVAGRTEVPVIIHIQGFLNPCFNAILPPAFSWKDMGRWYDLRSFAFVNKYKNTWRINCERELEIFRRNRYFVGRTKWDKKLAKLFQPNSNYYHVDEILRPEFYQQTQRTIPDKLTIVSVISDAYYKGLDVVLKTAGILKHQIHLDFEWQVFGFVNLHYMEKLTSLKHDDINIICKGSVPANEIKEALLNCTCMFHPSYIDNSPNSICEAQMLGVPVIACNVGGVSTLIDDEINGFLVPSNDPFMSASIIHDLYCDTSLNIRLGNKSHEVAQKRHNRETVSSTLINVYKRILANE